MTEGTSSSIRVAVVGGGIMGRGIAASLAVAGHSVSVVESDAAASASLLDRIAGQLESEPAVDAAQALQRITVGTEIDAVSAAGLVIEAVPEDMAIKTPLWQRLGELCDPAALLASNTSAFDIDSLAELVPGPERVLGTHWFNPALVVPCVEVVRGSATSQGVIDRAISLLTAAGKAPVVVRNSPGFVANRIQFALVREALLCLEEGLASAKDIDTIVSTSFGPRLAVLGPLANADLGGLDTYRSILAFLTSTLGDRFDVPAVLDDFVASGRLGTKTLAGIADYTSDSADQLAHRRDVALRRVLDAARPEAAR